MKNIGNDPRSLFNGNHFSSYTSCSTFSYACVRYSTHYCTCVKCNHLFDMTRHFTSLRLVKYLTISHTFISQAVWQQSCHLFFSIIEEQSNEGSQQTHKLTNSLFVNRLEMELSHGCND